MKSIPLIILLCLGCFISAFGQNKTDVYPLEKTQLDKEIEAQVPCKVTSDEKWEILGKVSNRKEFISLLRAKCFKQSNNTEALLKEISVILQQNFNPSPSLDTQISSLLKNEQGKIEIGSLNFLINSVPNHPYLLFGRAWYWNEQKNYKEAIEDGLKSLEFVKFVNPSNTYVISTSLKSLENDTSVFGLYEVVYKSYQEKLAKLEEILSKLPPQEIDYMYYDGSIDNLRVLLQYLCNNWANLYRKIGDYEKENAILEKSLWIKPKFYAYLARRIHYLSNKETEKAEQDLISANELMIEAYTKDIEREENTQKKAWTYREIGFLYLQIKRNSEAQVNFETAKTLDPNITVPKINLTNIPSCVPGIPCSPNNPNKP